MPGKPPGQEGEGDLPFAARPPADAGGRTRTGRRGSVDPHRRRYEGIDERFIEEHVDEEWSIGDYVPSGGELPAMVLVDAVTRLLPGALGHADSAEEDSLHGWLCSTARTTPDPRCTRTNVFLKCCSVATMNTSGVGVCSRPFGGPGNDAPIFWIAARFLEKSRSCWRNISVSGTIVNVSMAGRLPVLGAQHDQQDHSADRS